jgi:hypothetical protein
VLSHQAFYSPLAHLLASSFECLVHARAAIGLTTMLVGGIDLLQQRLIFDITPATWSIPPGIVPTRADVI